MEESELEPSFKVKFSSTAPEKHDDIYAYALKAEIVNAVGMSDRLFVFQRSPANNVGDAVDTFIQIAGPLELEEVPEDAPDLKNNMPYFRKSSVTLWFRTMYDLTLAKNKMDDDFQVLARTMKELHGELDKEETKNYG